MTNLYQCPLCNIKNLPYGDGMCRNEVHEPVKLEPIVVDKSEQKSIEEKIIDAVYSWVDLFGDHIETQWANDWLRDHIKEILGEAKI